MGSMLCACVHACVSGAVVSTVADAAISALGVDVGVQGQPDTRPGLQKGWGRASLYIDEMDGYNINSSEAMKLS